MPAALAEPPSAAAVSPAVATLLEQYDRLSPADREAFLCRLSSGKKTTEDHLEAPPIPASVLRELERDMAEIDAGIQRTYTTEEVWERLEQWRRMPDAELPPRLLAARQAGRRDAAADVRTA
ncbi:MAG: hypothetical protein AAF907_04310 [Planctomycetota bacterium]